MATYNQDLIMVRFGELNTKGKNMKDFIKQLGKNIKVVLKGFPTLTYEIRHDHIYIYLGEEDYDLVKERLKKVPGLLSFSLCKGFPRDLEIIKKYALDIASKSDAKTFKVITKRADKLFQYTSDQINREVASLILRNVHNLKVDVHNPELKININVREDIIYVYSTSEKGIGGYPVGIAGKGLMMLSGGIDSPVAAYLMLKRGLKLECIHFAAPPYTSENVIIKIHDLLRKLNIYQPDFKVYIVPFTDIQKKIYEVAGTSYAITIMRRMMLKIASKIAHRNNDLVLANGESIGQVASQTLKSIVAIEHDNVYMPIIRPLATYDKLDIIDIAKKIDTYDISIRPYEDCCTIFEVKDPTTSPSIEKIKEIESSFDFSPMVDECVKNVKVMHVSEEEDKKDEF